MKEGLFFLALFIGTVLFIIFKPGPNYSNDDALMRSFKMPLAALLESGKERATLADLYGGTMFEGDKICMHYPYPGIKAGMAARDVLKRYFPEEKERIADLKLRYDYPEWMVAVHSKEGVTVVMGDRRILGHDAFVRIETIETKGNSETFRYSRSESASHCFDFANSIFRVEKTSRTSRAVTLTDKDSPADKAFTPQPDTSPP